MHRVGGQRSHQISGGRTEAAPQGQVVCRECGRTFSRQGDLKRHKCLFREKQASGEALSSVHCATDVLRVLAALVCTREDSCSIKLKLAPSKGRTRDP